MSGLIHRSRLEGSGQAGKAGQSGTEENCSRSTEGTLSPGHAAGSQVHGATWILRVSCSAQVGPAAAGTERAVPAGVLRGSRRFAGSSPTALLEERSREQSSGCPGLCGRAGSGTDGALALVTNPRMTQMKADLHSAGGHVPVAVLALNVLLINTLLRVGIADS